MAFRIIKRSHNLMCDLGITQIKCYSSYADLSKLGLNSLKRSENRAEDYPVSNMIAVASQVLEHRAILIQGVSKLMKLIPVQACKFCPEVFVGEHGHSIQTCRGFKRIGKNRVHEWIPATLNDILVPVHTHRINHFHDVIKHDQRFDCDPADAVVELCRQAGADLSNVNHSCSGVGSDSEEVLSPEEVMYTAKWTLKTWEMVRSGVERLLHVYPAKKCKHCSEVHVGPSGHKARLRRSFKYESWSKTHYWEKASVDDLVPSKKMWCRRRHDPPVLLNERRDFYGHAPAVVDLCSKAGTILPKEYNSMMKLNGRSAPLVSKSVFPDLGYPF